MYIHVDVPDPYPGRCGCIKFNPHPNVMQYERCLGYADEPHICDWEMRKPEYNRSLAASIRGPEPKPWVRPGDAPRSTSAPVVRSEHDEQDTTA